MGRAPLWYRLNILFNRLLISRFAYRYWRTFTQLRRRTVPKSSFSQGTLHIDVSELWPNISLKTFSAIKFANDFSEFDYLIRANATCYVNFDLLQEFLRYEKQQIWYGGPIEKEKDFVSGWGIILSKGAVEILTENSKMFEIGLFDDESIGKIMSENGVKPISIPFKELFSEDDAAKITVKEANQYPMYRMKSFRNGNRNDYEVMQVLHKRLKEIS
jgi:hypothetical protein